MLAELQKLECSPRVPGTPPLKGEALISWAEKLGAPWNVVDEHHLHRHYAFEDFSAALAFTNKVGALAEEIGHHPDFQLGWGRVVIELHTHDSGGLLDTDFVMAAKIEGLYSGLCSSR